MGVLGRGGSPREVPAPERPSLTTDAFDPGLEKRNVLRESLRLCLRTPAPGSPEPCDL